MDYLENFMSECIKSGKTSINDIKDTAKERIKYIEFEYQKIDNLKKEEKALKSLLKQLGSDSDPQNVDRIESDADFSDLSDELKALSCSIIEFIQDSTESSSKEIIESISALDNSRNVLLALKYLLDKNILSREESTRKISKGSLWQEKEKYLNVTNLKS